MTLETDLILDRRRLKRRLVFLACVYGHRGVCGRGGHRSACAVLSRGTI